MKAFVNKIFKLLKNEYVFTIITKLFAILIRMAESILIARFLGSELQGTSTYITSVAGVASIILVFGSHQAYPVFKKNDNIENLKNRYISIQFLLFVIELIVSVSLSFLFVNDSILRVVFWIVPILCFSTIIQYVCIIESPNKKNLSYSIANIVGFAFILFLYLFFKRNFYFMVVLILLKEVFCSILCFIFLKPKFIYQKETFSIVPKMLRIGFFPMLALLLSTLNYKIDVIMLKQYESVTLSMVGIYSIGIGLSEKIALIPDTLMGVLASKLSKGAGTDEVAKVCRISFFLSLLICAGVLALGSWFLSFFYGDEYSGAYIIVVITSFGSLFIGFFKLITQYNIIQGKQIRNVLMLSVSICINILINILLIPIYGIKGAAIGTLVGHLVCGFVYIVWFCIHSKTPFYKMLFIQKEDFKSFKSIIKNN